MNAKVTSWEEAVAWLKAQPGQQALVRACFYDDPLLEAAERYHQSTEWVAVQQYLPPPGHALDLGAGRGIASYALARDGWKVTALEPDPSAMVGAGAIRSLASDAGLDIRVEEHWGESLPFDDASFDVVHARQVLHHARDLEQLCRETARVLKPNGRLIATREHVISRREDLPRFLAAHPLHRLYGGENAYLLEEFTEAMTRAGIDLDRVLNPYQSDINLFPETRQTLTRMLARRYRLPFNWMPGFLVDWLGARDQTPGRLYTFVGHRQS